MAQFPENSGLRGEFPKGWYDGANPSRPEFQLGAMYANLSRWVDLQRFHSANLGADGLKLSVGYMLGLTIDYYIALDASALAELTDALGGVTVNVNKDIPVPSGVIGQGANTRFADGQQLVAYVASMQADDDSKRLARTRCVVFDLLMQASPLNLARDFAGLSTFEPNTFRSDVPDWMVGNLASLAMSAQGATTVGMQFVSSQQGFSTSRPDFDLMRNLVTQARGYLTEPTAGNARNFWEPQTLDTFCAYDPDTGW